MPYDAYKYLPRRTDSEKLLCNKEFAIARISKCDGYQQDLTSMVYKFFDKISKETTTHIGTGIFSEDQQ